MKSQIVVILSYFFVAIVCSVVLGLVGLVYLEKIEIIDRESSLFLFDQWIYILISALIYLIAFLVARESVEDNLLSILGIIKYIASFVLIVLSSVILMLMLQSQNYISLNSPIFKFDEIAYEITIIFFFFPSLHFLFWGLMKIKK